MPSVTSRLERNAGERTGHQRGVGGIQPEQRRQAPIGVRAPSGVRGGEILAERQDALAADEAADLQRDGDERRKVDEAEAAQEQPGDEVVARRLERAAPQQMRGARQQSAARWR